MDLDEGDFRILEALQTEGRLSNQELAERVGMSTSPCWRRVRRLEEVGVIQGYQAQIDRATVGLGVLAFIRVKIDAHSQKEAQLFEQRVRELPEVVACYAIAGEADFLLQVVTSDLDAYADFSMATIRQLPRIKEMNTMLVLKEIKPLAPLPVKFGSAAPRRGGRKRD